MTGVVGYAPHTAQAAFHASGARTRVCVAGTRGGKSYCGAVETLLAALARPGSVGAVVAPNYPQLTRNVREPYLSSLYEGVAKFRTRDNCYEFVNGSVVWLLYAEQPDTMRGVGLSWAFGDELREWPGAAWEVLVTRLDKPESVFWGSTTPMGKDWVYDAFLCRAGRRWVRGVERVESGGDPDLAVFEWHTVDNTAVAGIRGVVDRARAILPEAFWRQEYEASIETVSGVVYPDFGDRHVVEDFEVPGWWPRIVGIDFGAADPTAMVAVAVDPDGAVWQTGEWVGTGEPLARHAEVVASLTAGARDVSVVAGRDAKQEILELQALGIPVQPAVHEFVVRYSRVTERLRAGTLQVFRSCDQTRRAFERYTWGPVRSDGTRLGDRPRHMWSDVMDALGYALCVPVAGGRDPAVREPVNTFSKMRESMRRWSEPVGNWAPRLGRRWS